MLHSNTEIGFEICVAMAVSIRAGNARYGRTWWYDKEVWIQFRASLNSSTSPTVKSVSSESTNVPLRSPLARLQQQRSTFSLTLAPHM